MLPEEEIKTKYEKIDDWICFLDYLFLCLFDDAKLKQVCGRGDMIHWGDGEMRWLKSSELMMDV